MTQSELARRLGISASYLNLIEHNRRALSVSLLLRVADIFPIDIKGMFGSNDARTVEELLEAFGDPMFDKINLVAQDVRELASAYPAAAEAVVRLYAAYRSARASAQDLGEALSCEARLGEVHASRFPSEEVGDVIQQRNNFFPELEDAAHRLSADANLGREGFFVGLTEYLKKALSVTVRLVPVNQSPSIVRSFDPQRRLLLLSEVLPHASRNFQLACQAGLLTQGPLIDRLVEEAPLTTEAARVSYRVALANYFAAALMMPYEEFLTSTLEVRYDIDLLGNRFAASFEQVCHRLSTLRRPGAEGIPFHMLRVDMAGNMSKRFSASGLRVPRFSGACPRWNTFKAFLTPGVIHTQISQMPDGQVFFGVAKTVHNVSGGFAKTPPQFSVGIGCDIAYAHEMVYADGLNLTSHGAVVPVGPSCRLCERMDCAQRAHPPLHSPLVVDENRRGMSFYAVLPPAVDSLQAEVSARREAGRRVGARVAG